MKRILTVLLLALVSPVVFSQNFEDDAFAEMKREFEAFRKSSEKEFNDFRAQMMAEYLDFVRESWEEMNNVKPVPAPKIKPVPPVVKPKEEEKKEVKPKAEPVKIDKVLPTPVVKPQPKPVEPIKVKPEGGDKTHKFTFFGTAVSVRFNTAAKVTVTALNENAIADAMAKMSNTTHDKLIVDCLALRENMGLSDWAYIHLLKSLATSVYGSYSNSAVLLMSYVYMQSGYKMRLATDNKRLYMLYATEHVVFNRPSYTLDNSSFYCIDEMPSRLYICKASFRGETPLSLMLTKAQSFTRKAARPRTISSKKFKDMSVTVSVNSNLLDFYSSYPKSQLGENMLTCWAMYANTPMDKAVRDQIYPQLKKSIAGLSPLEATNKLLNFVQTGLVYEYDDKVWGGDRPFFAEESLHYDYADCEDRSILFTKLVRDLVGLDAALLYIPGHLLAAVRFNEPVNGKYITIGGEKFIICEPTCLNGASVGWTNITDAQSISAIKL